MDTQQRWKWLLFLGMFAVRVTQAVHHRYVLQLTAVGTARSLLDVTGIAFIDDVQLGYFNKLYQKIKFKIPWIYKALGDDFITEAQTILVDHEKYFYWSIQFLAQNDTDKNQNHTIQLMADCEVHSGIEIKRILHIVWEGEECYRLDEQIGNWEVLIPEFKKYENILESTFWTKLRKVYMQRYCVDIMNKIIEYSQLKNSEPPEVVVSRHDRPDGRIILSCTATGFYPRAILMHWEKDGKLGVWGNESSSGILPTTDNTFYLRIILELPSGASNTGYSCVVEHNNPKGPTVYPVPGKPTTKSSWVPELGIVLTVILVLCSFGAIIKWKRRRMGSTREIDELFPCLNSPTSLL